MHDDRCGPDCRAVYPRGHCGGFANWNGPCGECADCRPDPSHRDCPRCPTCDNDRTVSCGGCEGSGAGEDGDYCRECCGDGVTGCPDCGGE